MVITVANLFACGNDAETLAQNHTVHSSLWTSFYATVTERYAVPETDCASDGSAGIAYRLSTDVWSIGNNGLAQFFSTQLDDDAAAAGVPQTVAVKKVDDLAFIDLKNSLSRYRVFAWPTTITCDMVTCTGDHGTATLQVNLNGACTAVTWPLYATGLPQGLEEMIQEIKDVI